jgi:hypothetical protein
MQQLWWIVTEHTEAGTLHKNTYHGEWRDVPCVGPDASDRENYP